MAAFLFCCLTFSVFALNCYGQTGKNKNKLKNPGLVEIKEESNYRDPEGPPPIYHFADTIRLQLYFDRIVEELETTVLNKKVELAISNESDYIHIYDSIYIKVFIARGQEYGKKMYLWRWDYFRKSENNFNRIGYQYYSRLPFNTNDYLNIPEYGQGLGTEGNPGYLMIYFRFKAE